MKVKVNWYVWSKVLLVSLHGFIYGYDIGFINGVKDMVGYRVSMNLSTFGSNSSGSCYFDDDVETGAILGLIISLVFAGGLIGSIVAGVFSDILGRKPTIIIGACLISLGSLLHTAAVHIGMALVGRLIGGFGLGVLYQVNPLYIAEISPEHLRGGLLTITNIYFASAYLVGTIVNLGTKNFSYGWRVSSGLKLIVALTLAFGAIFLPRSPRFLVKRKQESKALEILNRVYQSEDVAKNHMAEIRMAVELSRKPESFRQTLKRMFEWKMSQRLLIGFVIAFLSRATGSTFITFFSVSMFCSIGLPGFAVVIVLGVTSTIFIATSSLVIDKFGRKSLFLTMLPVIFVLLVFCSALIAGFHLEESVEAMDPFTVSQKVAAYIILAAFSIIMASSVVSVGNIPWIIVSEIFPLRAKGLMTGVCSCGYWIANILVGEVSAVLIDSPLKITGVLGLFASIVFILFLFILLLLPETKGLNLEKVDEVFSKPWLERVNVLYYLRCGCLLDTCTTKRWTRRQVPTDEEDEALQQLTSEDVL